MINQSYMQLVVGAFDEEKFKHEVLAPAAMDLHIEPEHQNFTFPNMIKAWNLEVMQSKEPDQLPALIVKLSRHRSPDGLNYIVFELDANGNWQLDPAYKRLTIKVN